MGRYPWIPAVTDFLEGVRPYYGEATMRTMTRGLKVIHSALQELRREGKVSTTNPKKLTKADVEMFLEWMKTRETRNGTGLNPTTRANYMLYLENLLKWVGNPTISQMKALHYIRFPQKVPSQVGVLSSEEIEELLEKLNDMPGWSGSVARFAVAIYSYTGLRRSELRRARLVDLDTESWTIVVAHPKGENSWAAPGVAVILPPARAEVSAFLEERNVYLRSNGVVEHEPLVPYVRKTGTVEYFTDAIWGKVKDDAQKHAGIPFKMQQLRASFATDCVRPLPANTAAAILGHSARIAAEHYWITEAEDLDRAGQTLRAALPDGALQKAVQRSAANDCGTPQDVKPQNDKVASRNELRSDATSRKSRLLLKMGAVGFEPTKAYANGFTARFLWPLGHTPASCEETGPGWAGQIRTVRKYTTSPGDVQP